MLLPEVISHVVKNFIKGSCINDCVLSMLYSADWDILTVNDDWKNL